MNNFQKSRQILIGISTFLTLVASLISDILIPIAPLALYFGISILIITIIVSILYIIPVTRRLMYQVTSLWFVPIFVTLNISYIILFTTFYYSDKAKEQGGMLAENTDIIKSIQENLHIVATNTKEIKESLNSIDIKLDNVKKETSKDPRKELANRGVEWSTSGFIDVLEVGDISSIKLFIEGGIDLYTREYFKLIPKILLVISNQNEGYKEIFKLAIENNLDLNKKFSTDFAITFKNNYCGATYFNEKKPDYFLASEYLCFLPETFQDEYIDIVLKGRISCEQCIRIRNRYIYEPCRKELDFTLEEIAKCEDEISKHEENILVYKENIDSYNSFVKYEREHKKEIDEAAKEIHKYDVDSNVFKAYLVYLSKRDEADKQYKNDKKNMNISIEQIKNMKEKIASLKMKIKKINKYIETEKEVISSLQNH